MALLPDSARISPMRTGTPTARVAHLSRSGRHSPIRGTIAPFKPAQVSAKSPQTASSSHSNIRLATASVLRVLEALACDAEEALGAGL
ncbi:hypothetical protein D9M68_968820 [compost metagenome]